MQKAEQIKLIQLLMDRLDEDKNVDAGRLLRNPASAYTDPELANLEWENFFQSHAQIIGMSGDLPEPGSFMTKNDLGKPILVTRDRDGKFRAFANICRHRGVVLEEAEKGCKHRFTCPFHAWSYDSAGAFVGMPKPDHFGDIEKASLNLLELPADEKHGFLWVNLDPNGEADGEKLLAGLNDDFDSWGFQNYVYLGDDSYEVDLNWKLAIDTFGETYHFNALHKNTLAPIFYGNVQCYDRFERNHRMILCKREIDQLRGKPESEWRMGIAGFPVYYLFPNIQVNVGDGNMILVRVYPVEGQPGKSISKVSFYAHPRALEHDSEIAEGSAKAFGEIIRDEDYVAAAAAQRGAESGMVKEMIFGRNEPALHHYHNTYRAALGLPSLEKYSER